MTSTRFLPPAEWRPRIAPTEQDPWRGRMIHGEVHDENASRLGGVSGHAGLFGSARDLLRLRRLASCQPRHRSRLPPSRGGPRHRQALHHPAGPPPRIEPGARMGHAVGACSSAGTRALAAGASGTPGSPGPPSGSTPNATSWSSFSATGCIRRARTADGGRSGATWRTGWCAGSGSRNRLSFLLAVTEHLRLSCPLTAGPPPAYYSRWIPTGAGMSSIGQQIPAAGFNSGHLRPGCRGSQEVHRRPSRSRPTRRVSA